MPKKRHSDIELRDFLDMFFKDHGFIRYMYMNMYEIVPGKMFRSAQPAPVHFPKLVDKGIKTIINLRGQRDTCGSYILEEMACKEHGIKLVNFPISSRDMPSKARLHRVKKIFDFIEYPALIHCKSGADRAGLASVLFLMLHENEPLEVAIKQLSLRYGHMKQSKTGMLDYFFDLYKDYNEKQPTDFMEWVDDIYDPAKSKEDFMSSWWANILMNTILRRE
ncbi:MAG: dual specificity protein phosphatase family protein [Alphaproteobacteria bacterium]|nr:dual specificity protein phosphatase family protein [Alphaproteobacteria bacterium]